MNSYINYRRFGTTYQSHLQGWSSLLFGCPETLVTTTLRCVTSLKSDDLIYCVIYPRFGTTYQSQLQAWSSLLIGCSETSLTTTLCCVRSQKSDDLIYIAAKSWYFDVYVLYIYNWSVLPEDDPRWFDTCWSWSSTVLIAKIIYYNSV